MPIASIRAVIDARGFNVTTLQDGVEVVTPIPEMNGVEVFHETFSSFLSQYQDVSFIKTIKSLEENYYQVDIT